MFPEFPADKCDLRTIWRPSRKQMGMLCLRIGKRAKVIPIRVGCGNGNIMSSWVKCISKKQTFSVGRPVRIEGLNDRVLQKRGDVFPISIHDYEGWISLQSEVSKGYKTLPVWRPQ